MAGQDKKLRTKEQDTEIEVSEDENPNAEEISDEIMAHLEELDEIRSRCNGKISRDIKVSLGLIREKTGKITEIAVGKEQEVNKLKSEIQTLKKNQASHKKELEELARKKEENNSSGERIQKEILAEVKTLREEVKAMREIKIGRKRGTEISIPTPSEQVGQDKGNGKGNMEAAGDIRKKENDRIGSGTKTYADMAGKKEAEKGSTGKGLSVRNLEENGIKEREEKIEVIRVKTQEDFRELVGKIRREENPIKSEVFVISVKKDDRGNIMLRLQGKQENRNEYREELKKCVKEKGRLETVQRWEYVHLSNLDALTTTGEIEEKICAEAELSTEEVKVTSLGPAFGESQKATIKIPNDAAEKLARKGKLGIGMMQCRVNIRVFETRCFKCGGAGHFANKCEEEANVGRCFRCGKHGHFARECEEEKWMDAQTGMETQKDRVGKEGKQGEVQ